MMGKRDRGWRALLTCALVAAAVATAAAQAGADQPRDTNFVEQVKLVAPSGKGSPYGLADVVQQGSAYGLFVDAHGVPPTSRHSAYAVWLAGGPGGPRILGYDQKRVRHRLTVAGALPPDFQRYREVLITLETHAYPRRPGRVVLVGKLR